MTTARHRETTAFAARSVDTGPKGGAPHGMWAVAWRQHRIQIAVLLGIVAVGAAALYLLRSRIVAVYTEFGCVLRGADPYGPGCLDDVGAEVWWNHGLADLSALAHLAMIVGPVLLGAFAAAPLFTREFSRGTHVLALTQSVSRTRWFTTKVTMLLVPLTAGLLALGYLMQWVDETVDLTAHGAMNQSNFFARSIVPTGTGLLAFGLALAIGMLTRNVVTALAAAILAGGAILFGVALIQPYVLPADRTTTSVAQMYPHVTQAEIDAERAGSVDSRGTTPDYDAVGIGSGYLDAGGNVLDLPNRALTPCYQAANSAGEAAAKAAGLDVGDSGGGTAIAGSGDPVADPVGQGFYDSAAFRNANNAAMLQCLQAKGVSAQFSDVLPGSMLWPLRLTITGILLAVAALSTGFAAWRLRAAVAKR